MANAEATQQPIGQTFLMGSDHAGFELKEKIKRFLLENGNAVEDFTEQFRERIDFPPVAETLCRALLKRSPAYGVLVCGTGIGMCMAANRMPGIRAALIYAESVAQYARTHNDANVLVFGGRTMAFEETRRYIRAFFRHTFAGGKYAERNRYVDEMTDRA